MDGKTLTRLWLDALDAPTKDELFDTDDRVAYGCLDRAAVDFCRETRCLTKTVVITTVASQQAYDLPPDFINLYLKNYSDRYTAKYYDGTSYSWPVLASFEKMFRDNLTDNKETPTCFSITDKVTQPALVTGTATAAGAKTAGQSILTDGTKLFTTTNLIYPRDVVHNTTDGSDGLVLSVTNATQLVTALFSGKKNAWSMYDAYVIQRATSKQLYLDAPSAISGHAITIPYVAMPDPVYSEYGFWRLPAAACHAIACEAAFFYQTRKGKYGRYPSAETHHIMFINEINRMRTETARARLQQGLAKRRY